MKWIGISGSWRHSTPQLERDVKARVDQIISSGKGIVTGGALGVDYLAAQTAMELDPTFKSLKVILPTSLAIYARHFNKRAREGVISPKQAKMLITQLKTIKKVRPEALIEGLVFKTVNEHSYYERNSAVVAAADELMAFQVNNSLGTQNAINTAHSKGKKVTLFSYTSAKT